MKSCYRKVIMRDNQAAIDLLDEWLADESGYDEATYPELAKRLAEEQYVDGTITGLPPRHDKRGGR